MVGDQVVREGEISEAETPGIDGGDGERGGRAVAERELQGASRRQVELVRGQFTDGDGVRGEPVEGAER